MRTTIKAKEGFVLTDGTIYGREILLGDGRSADDFHEITEEEYEVIMAAEDDENHP